MSRGLRLIQTLVSKKTCGGFIGSNLIVSVSILVPLFSWVRFREGAGCIQQHFLYLCPLPHGQGEFLGNFAMI